MSTGRDQWEVLTALEEADDQDEEDWDDEEDDAEAGEAGTVVTMTEGYGVWWPRISAQSGKGQLRLPFGPLSSIFTYVWMCGFPKRELNNIANGWRWRIWQFIGRCILFDYAKCQFL